MNKNRWKTRNIIIGAVLTLMVLFIQISPTSGKPDVEVTDIKPVFSSSIIQYWLSEDWDVSRWAREFGMLQSIGINEIILMNIGDTKSNYLVYNTSLQGYTSNDVDMIENVLTAAEGLDMKVRIGLGYDEDWWFKRGSDMNWLKQEAEQNIEIFNEVFDKYGSSPAISGWYFSYEFYQLTALTTTHQNNLNSFFKQMVEEIDEKTRGTSVSNNVMIAPFYNYKLSWLKSISGWSTMLENVLRDTGIDIVALQGSIGAGYNKLSQLSSLFAWTKKATDSVGVELYAVTETFTSTPWGNVPAEQIRISRQLHIVKDYVKGFVAFSINHFQNGNVDSQLDGYKAHSKYYHGNK